MKMSDLKTHHYCMIFGGLIIAASAVTGGGDRLETSRQLADQARARSLEIRERETEFVFDAKETGLASETAISRYQNGCVFVVAVADPSRAIAIIEGDPVVDLVSRQPLADGTVVCDYNGNTGIMREGVVQSVAFTGNQQVVAEAKANASFDARQEGQGHTGNVVDNQFGG